MMLNENIQEYILKLQEIKDKMEDELPVVDWTKTQSLEVRVALSYIRAAINALYLTEGKK